MSPQSSLLGGHVVVVRARRAARVEAPRILGRDHRGQHLVEHALVVAARCVVLRLLVEVKLRLPAPLLARRPRSRCCPPTARGWGDCAGGGRSRSPRGGRCRRRLVARVHAAGEHEVLPHQQAQLVGRDRRSDRPRRCRRPTRAACSCSRRRRIAGGSGSALRSTRVTKLSAGIQLAPFMNTGAPLTLMKKLLPSACPAGARPRCVRRPIRVGARVARDLAVGRQPASRGCTAAARRARSATSSSGLSMRAAQLHVVDARVQRDVGLRPAPGRRAARPSRARRPARAATTRATISASRARRRRACSGTPARRRGAPRPTPRARTGRQMPLVTKRGPQSQP